MTRRPAAIAVDNPDRFNQHNVSYQNGGVACNEVSRFTVLLFVISQQIAQQDVRINGNHSKLLISDSCSVID